MFSNIKDLLAKLKLIKEALSTGDLDKIGDVIEQAGILLGYAAYGAGIDDLMDAIAQKNWKLAGNAVGDLIKLISNNLPSIITNGDGAAIGMFGTPLTALTASSSMCPCTDDAIMVLTAFDEQPTLLTTAQASDVVIDPKTGLPIAVWIMIAQAAFEVFKIIRERRKNKPTP